MVYACSTTKEQKKKYEAKLSNIISDSSRVELVSFKGEDTSLLIMDYQYFRFDTVTGKAALPYQDSVNEIIVKFITDITYFDAIEVDLEFSPSFFDDALEEFSGMYHDATDTDGGLMWFFESSTVIKDERKDFCQVFNFNWNYTGGAHGNGFMEYHQVDKKTGKLLSLDDFISDIPELTAIADVIFREGNELTFDSDLQKEGYWFDDGLFKLNENFLFEDGKLVFVYNAYEIAPYSAGSITIEVPLKKISHLLKTKLSYKEN